MTECTGKGAIQPDYPGATVWTWAQAPAVCPRDGGPWRAVETGYRCLTCPGELVVGAALFARASGR
jgi:hypothetical protein